MRFLAGILAGVLLLAVGAAGMIALVRFVTRPSASVSSVLTAVARPP